MGKADMPEWVAYARTFIATGKEEFLTQAAKACAEPSVRRFLEEPKTRGRQPLDPRDWHPLVEHLRSSGRTSEALVVELIGLRAVAVLAIFPEQLDTEKALFTAKVCNHAASLAHEQGFSECEALFAGTLGTRAAKRCEWPEARSLLQHALGLYRPLAEVEPHIYRPEVARTLNNLGNVLRAEHDFAAARRALEEAVRTYRPLAKTEPRIYRSHVAGTLSNLGNILRREGDFPAARRAFKEALEIYRSLAEAEPQVHRADVAMTLNNLGNVLGDEGGFLAARRALEEGVETYRSLAKTEPRIYRPNVATTLNNLGGVLSKERDFPAARRAFEEALEIYRPLAETEPRIFLPLVAGTLNNLGNVLSGERDFPAARRAFDEALEIYRSLAETEPHIYRPDVAMTLSNLGTLLSQESDSPAGRRAFEESLEIYRSLAKTEPHIYRPDVAMTLNNLGNVLGEERDFPPARRAFEEALEIRRSLTKTEPRIHRPDVAMTLSNLGNVLREERDFPAAREALEEAVRTYRSLAETEPHIYRPDVAMTLNNLGNVLEELGQREATWQVSEQAVEAAEDPNADPGQIWLAKGRASAAYHRWLDHLVSRNDRARCFRCLAALREGQVRALGDDPAESLEKAAEALEEVSGNLGQRVRFLIPQSLTGSRMVLGVLDPDDPEHLQCFPADDFTDAAIELFKEIVSVFDKNDKRGATVRRKEVARLAGAAWKALPAAVRELLNPDAEHAVFISGDPTWTKSPWEALRFGDGGNDWLGLRRTLARWGPLTAASIRQIAPRTFGEDGAAPATGDGAPAAAILCPWNASSDPEKHLAFAKKEAENLDSSLRAAGYELLPDGRALLGQAAHPGALNEVLGNTTSVIHYTGHGAIIGREEALVLHGGDDKHPSAYFGRQEIGILKQRLGRDRLLRHRPLLVLNSCRTGGTRNFGGQREDLAWALLAEGAEAVIASALPVYDSMGQAFGESLYDPSLASPKGMGRTLVEVRCLLEGASRESKTWATWTLLTYHGNPYAQLPHVAEVEATPDKSRESGFLDRLAKRLGLRDASEAAKLLRQVRGS